MSPELPLDALRGLWTTFRWIWTHPLTARDRRGAFARWARWQVGSRLLPGGAVVPFVGETVLLIAPGMTGATGNVYVGLHEFPDMAFLLHHLRAEDCFVDVGANVGTYTILAAGVCHAEAIAVEPLPATLARLRANVRLNGLEGHVDVRNCGLAAKPGVLRFTRALDTVDHVVAKDERDAEAVEVPVTTLDELLGDRRPALIKVDVEGFETEVFAGGLLTLARPTLQALIVELNGSGARYGFDEAALQRQLESFGFLPCTYDPFARRLMPIEGKSGECNTI